MASRLPHKQEKAGSTPAPATNCPHPPTLGEPDQPIICPGPDIGCEACKEAAIICPLCQKPVDESNHETVLMNGRPVACHTTCPE